MNGRALLEPYLAAQLDRDVRTGISVLLDDGIGSGLAVPDLYLQVIQPAQYEIGRLWQNNRVSVAEEHIATGISQLGLSLLYPAITRAPANGKHVVVACVGGESHDLGARMVADFYEMAGFSVRYLGANVAAGQLIDVVKEDPPDLLALSVTMTYNLESLRQTVDRARSAVGDGMGFAIGGPACASTPGLAALIGADVAQPDVVAAVQQSAALLSSEVS
ncbi:MAG TPA: cobalamin-dependent protein [Propionibacteriaceae bacterium]|nr:cobalamin-dependent protein [Propionibacteriaceae bacterium]